MMPNIVYVDMEQGQQSEKNTQCKVAEFIGFVYRAKDLSVNSSYILLACLEYVADLYKNLPVNKTTFTLIINWTYHCRGPVLEATRLCTVCFSCLLLFYSDREYTDCLD